MAPALGDELLMMYHGRRPFVLLDVTFFGGLRILKEHTEVQVLSDSCFPGIEVLCIDSGQRAPQKRLWRLRWLGLEA